MSSLRRFMRRGQSSANSDAGIGRSEIDEGVSEERKLLHGTLRVTICKPDWGNNPVRRVFSQGFKENVGLGVGLGIAKFNTSVGLGVPFRFHCAHMVSNISITLEDEGTPIGTTDVPVKNILNGQGKKIRFKTFGKRGPVIPVKIKYLDVKEDPNWDRGIGSLEFSGVPNAFFSQRKGCKVSLYQDAHVPDSFNPNITLADGQPYQPKSCWEDVFDAINGAEHIIYITGWSVYTEISLIRDSPEPERRTTLGELLKKKANEGVQVLVLIWFDRTSLPFVDNEGMMATHGKETMKYFSRTRVHCVLSPHQRVMYTHHQKTVVVDSELPSGNRGIVSFVGGLDLCDGRYDTPSHLLFKTLSTVHHDDFYQPLFGSKIRKGGPREPWHDIHARLEGPIAWDVLDNFVQRWRKQGKKDVQLRKLEGIIIDPSEFPFNDDDQETWCVQLFRSIDSGAADFGFPETPEAAAAGVGLVIDKNNIIDRSIQDAYISAIRRAKNFIYIENQYFLGSSFAWDSDDIRLEEINSWHLIPKELSLKIVRKIEAGERFIVYVVVPMWPDNGTPEGYKVQEILFYQKKTMEMMYKDVIQALKAKGSGEDPRNYLAFFCLGNREEKKEGEYQPPKRAKRNSHYMKAQEARRFMVYVHSKMMIVDDEYIIVGSANINQRSMDGARDTEIAIGAYQPHHLATTGSARGQIYFFRKSLWYEHLGTSRHCFNQPQRKKCIKTVNKLAKRNWNLYSTGLAESDLPGHLLPYPVGITEDGAITELEEFKFFPDTEAPVLGSQSLWSEHEWMPSRARSYLSEGLSAPMGLIDVEQAGEGLEEEYVPKE